MNKKYLSKLLRKTYETNNIKRDAILMACSAYVAFTRKQIIQDILDIDIIESDTTEKKKSSIGSAMDDFLLRGWIEEIRKVGKLNRYQITAKGQQHLMNLYPAQYFSIQKIVDSNSFIGELCSPHTPLVSPSQDKISKKCEELREFLLKKNEAYGDSSLSGSSIFDLPREAQIQARITDKLNRIKNLDKDAYPDAYLDTIKDLTGYLILYQILLEEN